MNCLQMIHIKFQDLFSLKIKIYIYKMLSAAVVCGALRVKIIKDVVCEFEEDNKEVGDVCPNLIALPQLVSRWNITGQRTCLEGV